MSLAAEMLEIDIQSLDFLIRFLWAAFWQGLLLAFLCWALQRFWPGRSMSAATRHAVVLTALTLSLAAPLATTMGGLGGLVGSIESGRPDGAVAGAIQETASRVDPKRTGAFSHWDGSAKGEVPTAVASGEGRLGEAGASRTEFALPPNLAAPLLGLWLLMATWRSLRLLREGAHLTWQKRSARRDVKWRSWLRDNAGRIGLTRRVDVLRAGIPAPMAVGFARPSIMLPHKLDDLLSEPEMRLVIAHEAAHLARRDDWANLWQQLARTLLCFHPAVWWLDAQASEAREMACDDRVVRVTGERKDYARSLLKVLESCRRGRVPSLAAGAAPRGRMRERIRRVLDSKTPIGAARGAYLGRALLLLCMAVAAGFLPPELKVEARQLEARPSLQSPQPARPCASGAGDCAEGSRRSYTHRSDERFLQMRLRGEVGLTEDDRWVRFLSPDGFLSIEEEFEGVRRRIEFKNDSAGIPSFDFQSSKRGEQDPRPWLASLLPQLVLEAGLAARRRVARIRASQGVAGVLEEMKKISKDSVFRRYFGALFDSGPLSATEKAEAVRLMSAQVESDSGKGKMLQAAAGHFLDSAALSERYFRAVSEISSDSRKEKLLVGISEQAFERPGVVPEYLNALAGISSDSNKRKALQALFEHSSGLSDEMRIRLLGVAEGIRSDSGKGKLLVDIGGYVFQRPQVAPEFLKVLAGITSDSTKGRALQALFKHRGVSDGMRIRLLGVAEGIRSDSAKSRLVVRLAGEIPESGEVREALERLAGSIRSRSARDRAWKAL